MRDKKLSLIFALNKNSGRIWIENNSLVHLFAIRNENFQQNYLALNDNDETNGRIFFCGRGLHV